MSMEQLPANLQTRPLWHSLFAVAGASKQPFQNMKRYFKSTVCSAYVSDFHSYVTVPSLSIPTLKVTGKKSFVKCVPCSCTEGQGWRVTGRRGPCGPLPSPMTTARERLTDTPPLSVGPACVFRAPWACVSNLLLCVLSSHTSSKLLWDRGGTLLGHEGNSLGKACTGMEERVHVTTSAVDNGLRDGSKCRALRPVGPG